jgi:hypothetical protein
MALINEEHRQEYGEVSRSKVARQQKDAERAHGVTPGCDRMRTRSKGAADEDFRPPDRAIGVRVRHTLSQQRKTSASLRDGASARESSIASTFTACSGMVLFLSRDFLIKQDEPRHDGDRSLLDHGISSTGGRLQPRRHDDLGVL